MVRKFILLLACLFSGIASSQELGAGVDAGAINQLQKMIFDGAARKAAANQTAQGKQANDFVEAFPPWATQEILEIMMMIMKESGEGAVKHSNAYNSGGVGAARASFSPAVNARVDALIKRLAADPGFNNPKNLQQMQGKMPVMQGKGS